jgi:PAS domain S-box-containing protein
VPEVGRPRILVVDDDEIKRYTVVKILSRAGFDITEASNGATALEAVRSNPDLVILDVNMPDVNGFELCRRLKADPATAAIVVLLFSATATESSDITFGLEGGADGYLAEPVEASQLIATVRSMLRIRQAERTARALATQWQATFDAIKDGICVLDARDRVLRCNAAMEGFAGKSCGDVAGEWVGSLFGQSRADETSASWPPGAHDERRTIEFAVDDRWYHGVADPVVDEGGAATGSVFIVSDVTETKARERERSELLAREREARSQAEAANRAKDEFLATISHELRTPLNSMLGWLSLLLAGELAPADVGRAYETLERNAKSQAQLISDILDVSRIITGKVRIAKNPVDLGEVLDAVVGSIGPAAASKGVEIEFSRGTSIPIVTGDRDRLQQVVANLVSNAIKFTPSGGRVRVALERDDSHVSIVVADTGAGIRPDFLPYVFERFRQADSSTTRIHSGLGLGLSIVRHFVELHGGLVQAESGGLGFGSTFTVRLPISRGLPVDEVAPSVSRADVPDHGHVASTMLDGVRVLVLDDDDDTRTMLVMIFEQCNAEVYACATAAEALAAVPVWHPHVVVSDIGLPEQDGHSMIRELRALDESQGSRTPAIALTAYAWPADRAHALESGFEVYLTKPADPSVVTAEVARLAAQSRADAEGA